MNKIKRVAVIIFALVITFSMFGFTFKEITKTSANDYPHTFSQVYYGNQHGRGFTWCTGTNFTKGTAQIIRKIKGEEIDWIQARNLDVSTEFLQGKGSKYIDQEVMIHKANVENILDGETYFFRVGASGVPTNEWITGSFDVRSDDDYFENGLSFFHITDTQHDNLTDYKNNWLPTIEAAYKKFNPDFILHTGDITNNNWSGSSDLLEFHWSHDIGNEVGNTPVLMTSTGNHDSEDEVFNKFYNFKMPENASTKTGSYCSYDLGNVHFINIDTNESGFNLSKGLSEEQITWIEQDLSETTADFIIIQTHKGMLSYGKHHLDNEMPLIRDQLMPLLDKYNVDLFLNGHDHIYSRTEPVVWNATKKQAVNADFDFDGKTHTYNVDDTKNTGTIHISLLPAAGKRELLPKAGQTTSDGHTFTTPIINYLDSLMSTNNVNYYTSMPISFVNNQNENPDYYDMDKYCMFSYVTVKGQGDNSQLIYDIYIVNREDNTDIRLFDSFKINKKVQFITTEQKTLDTVIKMLENLPSNVTKNDEQIITEAQIAYDGLSQSQQNTINENLINNLNNAQAQLLSILNPTTTPTMSLGLKIGLIIGGSIVAIVIIIAPILIIKKKKA